MNTTLKVEEQIEQKISAGKEAMLARIMVATDFSPVSDRALDCARPLGLDSPGRPAGRARAGRAARLNGSAACPATQPCVPCITPAALLAILAFREYATQIAVCPLPRYQGCGA
jgi:hypothetical protein